MHITLEWQQVVLTSFRNFPLHQLLQLQLLHLQLDPSPLYTNRVRCRQVILRYDCQFGLTLVEAVQLLLFSPVLLLQEQTSGTQAAQQAEPKQPASQVSIKPGPCFKAKASQGCNNPEPAPSRILYSGMQLNWCPWLAGTIKYW